MGVQETDALFKISQAMVATRADACFQVLVILTADLQVIYHLVVTRGYADGSHIIESRDHPVPTKPGCLKKLRFGRFIEPGISYLHLALNTRYSTLFVAQCLIVMI